MSPARLGERARHAFGRWNVSGPVRAPDGSVERAPCNHCGAEMPLVVDRFGAKVIVRHRDKGERKTTCPGSFRAAADAPPSPPGVSVEEKP